MNKCELISTIKSKKILTKNYCSATYSSLGLMIFTLSILLINIKVVAQTSVPTLKVDSQEQKDKVEFISVSSISLKDLDLLHHSQIQEPDYLLSPRQQSKTGTDAINGRENLSTLKFSSTSFPKLDNSSYPSPPTLLAQEKVSTPDNLLITNAGQPVNLPPVETVKIDIPLIAKDVTSAQADKLLVFLPNQSQEIAQNYSFGNKNQIREWKPQNPYTFPELIPQLQLPETQVQPPSLREERESFQNLMGATLSLNAQKYPYIVNSGDNLLIKPLEQDPSQGNTYVNFSFSHQDGIERNKIPNANFSGLTNWSASVYPKNHQFFWILDNNAVVIETTGVHVGSFNQGRSTTSEYFQRATSSINFWGIQTAWAFPPKIFDLVGQENVRFTSVALEVDGVPGVDLKAPELQFSSSWVPGSSLILFDNPDYGTTYSPLGGGSLFSNLEANNAPVFLQGFPTVNLQGLVANGRSLKVGETIPQENLNQIGLNWGDFFTGQGYSFNPVTSSQAGIKTRDIRFPRLTSLRDSFVPNKDILTILSNPYLTPEVKNFHTLNSMWWVGFGGGSASVSTTNTKENVENWQRFSINFSHNLSLLKYDPNEIRMTYSNIFSNPGFSYVSNGSLDFDTNQSVSHSLGLLLGLAFEWISHPSIDQNLNQAQQQFEQLRPLSSLKTRSTPQQRSEMNRRLNSTLAEANQSSLLNQISGSITFSGNITPQNSFILQARTGSYQRSVQFFEQKLGDWSPESPVFINSYRNPNFGPLTYQGYNIPVNGTQIQPEPSNHKFNIYNIITTPDNISRVTNVQEVNRPVMTTVPFPDAKNPVDIGSGLIQLNKNRTRTITNNYYAGSVNVPSLELSLAGSEHQFSYSLTMGSWLNLFPNSSPQVNQAESSFSGISPEPTLGFYTSGGFKWILDDLKVSEDKKSYRLIRHVPFLNFSWNSASNRLNSTRVTPGYSFLWQNPNFNYINSILVNYTPQGLNSIIPEMNQGELVLSNLGSVQIPNRMQFKYSLDQGQQTYWNTSLTFPIIQNAKLGNLSIGAYYRNYVDLWLGLNSKLLASVYGGIIEYTEPKTNSYMILNLGTNGSGMEALLTGGLRLKF